MCRHYYIVSLIAILQMLEPGILLVKSHTLPLLDAQNELTIFYQVHQFI